MGVAIREYKLKNSKVRLSLDIYHEGKSKFENLDLFLYEKPNTTLERDHNKRTKALAESIRSKRVIEIQEHRYGVTSGFKAQASFLQYFKKLTDERKRSEGNYGNWASAYKHLVNFAKGHDVKFSECNEAFLNRFKDYLLYGKITKSNTDISKSSASSYLLKVKAALNQAVDEAIIVDNPAKRVKGIKYTDNRREFLLAEELRRLSDKECLIPMLKQAFLFSCLTGLRWSDINKLSWKEIVYSEVEGKFKINFTQKKTKGVEYHPISDQAVKLLGSRKNDEDRVFKGLKYSAWHNLRLAQWVMDAGISKKITFHCARHTYAT